MATPSSDPMAAMPPPRGLQSNFVDPPTMIPVVIAGTVVIHLFTVPFLFARIYVNVFVSKRLHVEDYLCYLSYLGCIAFTSAVVFAESVGMARHVWDIPLTSLPRIIYTRDIIIISYTVSGGLAKTMVFLQLKKIFTTGAYDAVFVVVVGSLVANGLFYMAMLFMYIFTCLPRKKMWDPTVEGHCLDSNKLNLAMGSLNLISDFEAFLVPAWAIWHLNMDLKRKIQVFAIFGVGAIAVATGAVGLYFRVILMEQRDFTWLLTQAGQVCMAEIAAVIIVGCCPYVPRFLHSVKLRGAGGDTAKKSFSIPPKPTGKLNTFAKYLSPRSGLSNLGSPTSEECLEMHQYEIDTSHSPSSIADDSVMVE